MLLTKDTSDIAIITAVSKMGFEFYDGQLGVVFDASPCENCGTMTAHGNPVTIEAPTDAVHRTLMKVLRPLPFVEVAGFDDDGNESCEECE